MSNRIKSLIIASRKKYKSRGYINCPLLNNEKIYFTTLGFEHLLQKGRISRTMKEIRRRLYLLDFVPDILQSINADVKVRNRFKVTYWSFTKYYSDYRIIVVIRQISGESKKFFSVMDRR